MSERYWITGAQIGTIIALDGTGQKERVKKLLDEIIDKQFIDNIKEPYDDYEIISRKKNSGIIVSQPKETQPKNCVHCGSENITSLIDEYVKEHGCACDFAGSRLNPYRCNDCKKEFDWHMPKVRINLGCLWFNPNCPVHKEKKNGP